VSSRMRDWLSNYFVPGFVILFLSAIFAGFLSFINNIFGTIFNPLFAAFGLRAIIELPLAVYFVTILTASIIGFFIKIPAVQRFVWKIPVISLPFKIAYWMKVVLRFPFVRVEQFDGNRILGIVIAVELKRAYSLNGDGVPVPNSRGSFDLVVFIPAFPAPVGGYWIWSEPRRIEYLLNSKKDILARAFSAGLSLHTKEGEPALKTLPLKGLTLKQINDLLKLSEVPLTDIDIYAGES